MGKSKSHDQAQFVQMQLVYAMQRAQNAHETAQIAEAMSHAKWCWAGILREEERLEPETCCGSSSFPNTETEILRRKRTESKL